MDLIKEINIFFQASTNGVILHDQGEILFANDIFLKMFNCSLTDIRNQSIISLIHDDDKKNAVIKIVSMNQDSFLIRGLRNKTDFPLMVTSKNIDVDNSSYSILVFEDISHESESKRKVEENFQKAIIAEEKNKSLLKQIKTRLRPSLREIVEDSQILIDHMVDINLKEQINYLKKISENSNQIMVMINDLIDISEVEKERITLHKINTNLYPITINCHEQYQKKLIESNIEFLINTDGTEFFALTDKHKTEQILDKLLNFIFGSINDGKLILSLINKASVTEMVIEYNGNLFTKFEQNILLDSSASINRSYNNKELNLLLVKKLINIIKATINIEIDSWLNTKVIIKFPKYKKNRSNDKQHEFANEGKIFILDDEAILADIMHKFLEIEDYNVKTCTNSQIAFDEILKFKPDLIISDIMMPIVDGYQILRKVKNDKTTQHIPVVLLSGYADEDRGIDMGADAFLRRPLKKNQLFEVVRKLIKRNHPK